MSERKSASWRSRVCDEGQVCNFTTLFHSGTTICATNKIAATLHRQTKEMSFEIFEGNRFQISAHLKTLPQSPKNNSYKIKIKMAQSFNILTQDLRGEVGKTIVFRQRGDKTFVARYPRPRNPQLKATQKQLKQRSKFQEAVLYAKTAIANPTQKAIYQAHHKVKRKLMTAFNVAIADYLNPPVVHRIDTSNYHGNIGDKIYFIILDNFSVQAVKVALHQSGGTLIEQGEAVKEGMLYVYTATAAQSSITGSTLTVTVTDLPKNVTEKKQTL